MDAFTDLVTAVRKAIFGYTEEEKEALKKDGEKLKDQQEKPWYDSPVGAIEKKLGLNSANAEMFLALFGFLFLVLLFKR